MGIATQLSHSERFYFVYVFASVFEILRSGLKLGKPWEMSALTKMWDQIEPDKRVKTKLIASQIDSVSVLKELFKASLVTYPTGLDDSVDDSQINKPGLSEVKIVIDSLPVETDFPISLVNEINSKIPMRLRISIVTLRALGLLYEEPPTEDIDTIEEGTLSRSEKIDLGLLKSFFDAKRVPENLRSRIAFNLRIEIARATRPTWLGRLERGGELATLSAPLFLKWVHADDIGLDGTVRNDVIRAIDPELFAAVEQYISKRKLRGRDMGDAEGLRFVLTRPARAKRYSPPLPKLEG